MTRTPATPLASRLALPLAGAVAVSLLLCAGPAAAQMYKWVDGNGVTHYSDAPPPPDAPARTKVEIKSFAAGPQAELPPQLAEAARYRPVTLYSTSPCDICDQARAMLQARGIPYKEKTVNTPEDRAALNQAGGNGQLPLLLVGRTRQIGFEQNSWDVLLSDAGYPTQNMLPPDFRQAAPTPAAPPPQPSAEEQAAAAAKAAADEAARLKKLPPLNATPDFQF
ncbi:glutaredoxin family protein [Duganella sp. FT3S]|uniref:Glutaredoxin family protein n=1 Tax=Rugamonas fusca TaxID=2758568 RepID=A0A7W2ELN0_9BURK|nr:glutaredoxin family protein [Rugamonas fusca]MBA5608214.1 glutaredoxin family protein [Rugamonas fusca]